MALLLRLQRAKEFIVSRKDTRGTGCFAFLLPTGIPQQRVQRTLIAARGRRDVRRGETRYVAVMVLCFPHGSHS